MDDDFRVEVELDDEEHGYSTEERLRAADLDDEARRRLGSSVMVTRDGSRLFLYASTPEQAREAERVVRVLVDEDELSAVVQVTRWHPIEEEWKDADLPLPATSAEEDAEYAAREAAEEAEAEREGTYDWRVAVHAHGHRPAVELAARLSEEGLHVTRRWRYVTVGVPTEERAEQLAERVRAELPDADVRIDVDLSDVEHSPLQFVSF